MGPTLVTSETLDKYPSLECVVGTSVGLDHFDLTNVLPITAFRHKV